MMETLMFLIYDLFFVYLNLAISRMNRIQITCYYTLLLVTQDIIVQLNNE